MLWYSLESPGDAILMTTHNIGFYEEISKVITIYLKYHQIHTLFLLLLYMYGLLELPKMFGEQPTK